MENINRVLISGNLTREPELRMTAGGMAILTFGVAVNDRRKNPQSGDWEDYANYIDCTTFGNRASSLHQYLSKGMKVAVEGKLRYSQWEKDGQKRSKLEVIVDTLEFMSRSNASGGQQVSRQSGYSQQANNAPYTPNGGRYADSGVYDQDIPF